MQYELYKRHSIVIFTGSELRWLMLYIQNLYSCDLCDVYFCCVYEYTVENFLFKNGDVTCKFSFHVLYAVQERKL